MKMFFHLLVIILFTATILIGQESKSKQKENNSVSVNGAKGIDATQAVEGQVIFSDGTNQLMRITDEGNFGAIQFQNGIPDNSDFKLYRNGTDLFFGPSKLTSNGTIQVLNDLTDAKTDATSIFIGMEAGLNDDGGFSDGNTNNNAALGTSALKSNTTGASNTALGNASMLRNEMGIYNVAVGNSSLGYNTSGFNNVALGVRSLYLNSTGYFNVGLGYQVGYYNQEGVNNTFIGSEAGKGQGPHNKSGGVFIGYQAGINEEGDNKLYINNDGSSDPLIWGDFTDGIEQVKINGDFHVAGNITTDGFALGPTELNDLTDAVYDGESLFIGNGSGVNDDAGSSDGTKNFNVGVGKNALTTNTSGDKNSALGIESLLSNSTGSRNSSMGAASMYNNISGNANVALGYQANYFNEAGDRNTIIGTRAGYGSTGISISGNVLIGYQAGYNEITSDKLYIENSDSDTPLIWGDFEADQVRINGSFEATTKIVTPKIKLTTGAAEGHILTSDTDGNATWQAPEKIGFSAYLEYSRDEFYYAQTGDNLFEYFVEEHDQGTVFDPVSGEFTAPSSGFYNFNINVSFLNFSADFKATIKFKKNGQTFPGSAYEKNVNSIHDSYTTISFSVNTYLQANDVITAWFDAYNPIYPTGGGVQSDSYPTVTGGDTEYSSTFSGFKIY